MTIVLTGATGFVGGQVLRRILDGDHRRVICLVRADSRASAARRGRQTLYSLYGKISRRHLRRTEWIPADLELERLGLDEACFADVAARTEEIFHCAASTSFELSAEDARAINYTGLTRVHELALAAQRAGSFRRLNHISTAYVSGDQTGTTYAADLPAAGSGLFRNTYESSKADAERFLREESQVPWAVFRPSIVVGDSQTGETSNWNVVYYPMKLMADGKIPYIPHLGRGLVDCVPVDWVADAIVALARRDDVDGETFNLSAGDDAITVSEVIEQTFAGLARRAGHAVEQTTKPVGRIGWKLLGAWARLRSRRAATFLDRFAVYEPYCAVQCVMNSERTQALLAEEGIELPDMNAAFARVVDYALEQNFGRSRSQEREEAASVRIKQAIVSAVENLTSGEISGLGAVA